MSFLSLIGIEIQKLHRSKILPLLSLPVIILWIPSVLNAGKNFEMDFMEISPEHNFLIQGFMGMAWFLIPATLVICTVLLMQTEQSNNGILKMLALPVSPAKLSLAKFTVMLLLSLLQVVFAVGAYYICAALASETQHYSFALEPRYVMQVAGRLYLSALPMAAVFWTVATVISTPIFAIGIGLASIIPSVLMINTRLWSLYPMCYPFYLLMSEYSRVAAAVPETSVQPLPWFPVAAGITILFMSVSCFRFGYTERR